MPRPPKPTEHLDAVRHLMGTMPDHEVAEKCSSTASIVGRYRRKYDIPPYEGYKFGKGQEPPSKSPTTVPRKKPTNTNKRRRGSKIDAYFEEVGRVPDALIAEKAGVSVEGVRMFRRRNSIELEPDAHLRQTLLSVTSAEPDGDELDGDEEGGDRSRRIRRSKIDPFRDQVGKVPDTEIASLAEVTPEAVRMYRRKHHIAATWREDDDGAPGVPSYTSSSYTSSSYTSSSSSAMGSGATSSSALAALTGLRGDIQGYAISVQSGGATLELIMLANNIAEAAARAVQKASGEVVAVRHLGPALL